MRVRSGSTTTYAYFVALDSADGLTRKTGLSSFTVYRSRNNGAATVYTTPTISELSASNMPGVYALLLDEDTTITSGADTEEIALHITATGMVPVTRVVELYRREVTAGETLTVSSGGLNAAMGANVITATALATDTITAAKIAPDAIGASELAADAVAEIQSGLMLASSYTAPLSAAGTRTALGMASANLDTQLGLLATAASLATVAGYVDTEVAAIKAQTDKMVFTVANQLDVNVVGWKGATAPAMTGDAFARLGAPAGASVSADIAAIMTAVGDVPTNAELAAALAGLSIPTATDNATALFAKAFEGAETVQDFLRLARAALYGKSSGMDTTSPAFRDKADAKNRIQVVGADEFGNRPTVNLDPS